LENKKKATGLLLYLGIPIIAILLMTLIFTQNRTEPVTTSEMVGYFQDGEVEKYELNYGSGAIKIQLKDTKDSSGKEVKGKIIKGTIADPDDFVKYIEPYYENNADLVYNHVRASDNSMIFSIVQFVLMIGIFGALWFFMMKKMGGGLGGKEMSFGKAKIKNTNDENAKQHLMTLQVLMKKKKIWKKL